MLKSALNKENIKLAYYNEAQLLAMMIGAPEETHIWGRGTGKSFGRIAPRSLEWFSQMPRGTFVFVAATYQQHLTRTLPAIINGWENLGFKRDRDFFVGSYAPKKWKWDLPFQAPLRTEFFIHTRFGSGVQLVSQDRPGSANGISIDAIAGDEAKFLKQKAFEEELLPAMRGNRRHFEKVDSWNSILLCSDMPTSESGNWLLEKKKNHDQHRVDMILKYQLKIQQRYLKINSMKLDNKQINIQLQKIRSDQLKISKIRRGDAKKGISRLSTFAAHSSYINKDVLGEEYFITQKKNMSEFLFRTAIGNERIRRDGQGFYPHLSDDQHGYSAYNNSYLDSVGYDLEKHQDQTSLQDEDVNPFDLIHVAMDYGGSFNCIVAGLPFRDEARFVNSFFVSYPGKIRDVVEKFCQYYRHHKRKEIVYHYDHTAIGTSAAVDFSYFDEAVKCFESNGWTVHENYLGHTPSYEKRYNLWEEITTDRHEKRFRFNLHNCSHWYTSCELAPMKDGRKGIEKVKTSERKDTKENKWKTPQEDATHFSDAGDTLLIGMINYQDEGPSSSFTIFG